MANLIDTVVKGTLRVIGSIYGKIWAQAGGSGEQGNVVVSQSDSTNRSTSITNASASSGSEVGSVYQDSNWWSWVNVRHRNGYSDGNNYGMYIKSLMTADGSLIWNKNYNGTWTGERTILDSYNFANAAGKNYLPLTGGTLTGGLIGTTAEMNGIAANRSNTQVGGGGLSLYGNSTDAQIRNYGLAFRGTSEGGTHGYVTADWATYNYMTSGAGVYTRGWIWQSQVNGVRTNVASIDGAGNLSVNGRVSIGCSGTTKNAAMLYNSTNQSIEFVF